MQSICGRLRLLGKHTFKTLELASGSGASCVSSTLVLSQFRLIRNFGSCTVPLTPSVNNGCPSVPSGCRDPRPGLFLVAAPASSLSSRHIATSADTDKTVSQDTSASVNEISPRIKFKRLDKTARHIMQILDKEAVQEAKTQREIPEIKPGYTIQLRLESPENKRRIQTVKGIVIARHNAGLHTTIRIRRLVAGVGVEQLLPLYSPIIKEIAVIDKKKVRRAKLYYLRDKINALKK